MRHSFASSSPLFIRWPVRTQEAAVDESETLASTTSTTTTSQTPRTSLLSSGKTSPSPTRPPRCSSAEASQQAWLGVHDFGSKVHPCDSSSGKAHPISPVAAFKQRLLHKASSIKFKVRRTKESNVLCSADSKVPPPAQQESFIPDPPETPYTVLPARDRTVIESIPRTSTLCPADFQPLHLSIRDKQRERKDEKDYFHRTVSSHHTFVKMASEAAQPPVSYSRLQQITTSACEKALGSVTSYNHASTEAWNTEIINTILGTLVEETTPQNGNAQLNTPAPDADSQSQPPFKYVVNSTIIQHAPLSSGSSADPAVTGRRGMHAASGAFWSNEKDGMWSYKYSAAESKGFDVVIGIIFIFVG